ncbi:MAG: PQQ-dependent sugar dehydrogenase [bacterium]|nr:PQQ-dependent sugar dehydrogenase [bacterium]
MKKIVIWGIIFLIGAGIVVAAVFYRENLRGIWPALTSPSEDIVKIIEEQNLASENSIDFPLKLPPGFSISIFAKGLGGPRVLARDPVGNILASIPSEGRVVAVLPDANGDGLADSVVTIADGLHKPHGLAFRCREKCQLYIAEEDQVAVYDYDVEKLKALHKKKIVDLPRGGNHTTRTILFLPYPDEDTLLISVGSSCNVCRESDSRRAKILSVNADGSNLKTFASGLRNAVFMAIHPVLGSIWATEMGRDLIGDDIPPDEINIVEEGKNYGWPICYGQNVHDASFDKNVYIKNPCEEPEKIPSYIDIPAHSAPLGLVFIPEEGWPEEYWYNLLVAYHGSWNRTEPAGYKIVRYRFDWRGIYLGEEDFISGWLQGGEALGRPVDILVEPGGKIYVSDDKAGVIYLITYDQQPTTNNNEMKDDLIRITTPKSDAVVQSPLVVEGEARGNWFFEADFPVRVFDEDGTELGVGIARAEGEWMTTDFVAFSATVQFRMSKGSRGTVVFQKNNPSDLPEYDAEIRIPVRFW